MSPQRQASQSQRGMVASYQQWRDAITALATLPALTVMVFMRQKVGWDKLTYGSMYGMAFVLYVLNTISHEGRSLMYFGQAFLVAGLWQRRERWKDLVHGEPWHTFSHGVSWFEFLPIRQDLVYRVVDPALAFLAGLVLRKLGFSSLGLWVMFSALCFQLVEQRVYEMRLRRELDAHNDLIESRVQAESVAQWDGQGDAKAPSLRATCGIATGVDASLQAQIARRKKQAAAGAAGEVRP